MRSDGRGCFAAVTDAGYLHVRQVVSSLHPRNLLDCKGINTVLGDLRTALAGKYTALRYYK